MSKEVPSEMISQLATLMEQDPKIQLQLKALLGIKDTDVENPAPKDAPGPAAPPSNKGKDSQKQEVDASPRPELEEASDMMALVPVTYIPRRIKYVHNQFVPNLAAMFWILYTMDSIVIRKFRARRSAQLLAPPMNILYFAELVCIQVARCQSYARQFQNSEDEVFLDTFLKRYPPETISIPGFLLPFFKALTTYIVQNEQYKRVSPRFPFAAFSSPAHGTDYHWSSSTTCGAIFPCLPLIVAMAIKFKAQMMKASPKVADFKTLEWFLGSVATGKTDEFTTRVDLGYVEFNKDCKTWTANNVSCFNCPGLAYPLPLSKHIIESLADEEIDNYKLPDNSTAKPKIKTLQSFMCMEDLSWFGSFLGPMADYANLFNGSGTLADCSPDGPSVGANVFTYSATSTAIAKPALCADMTLNKASAFPFIGKMTTTQNVEEPTTERLSALTHIHARIPSNHYARAANLAANVRAGNVWNQRPIYGPSAEHEELESFAGTATRYIKKVFNA